EDRRQERRAQSPKTIPDHIPNPSSAALLGRDVGRTLEKRSGRRASKARSRPHHYRRKRRGAQAKPSRGRHPFGGAATNPLRRSASRWFPAFGRVDPLARRGGSGN